MSLKENLNTFFQKTRKLFTVTKKETENKPKLTFKLIPEPKEKQDDKIQIDKHEVSDEIKNQIKGSFIRSVGVKLFVTIFAGVLICVMMMGQFATSTAEKIIEEEAIKSGENTIEQLAINLNNLLTTYEDLSLSLLVDQTFHTDLSTFSSVVDDYERLTAMRNVSTRLQNYLFSNDDITGVALIPINESLPVLTAGSSQITVINEIKQEPWFEETIAKAGKMHWIETQPEGVSFKGHSPTFANARLLRNSLTGKSEYIVLFDFKLNGMLKPLESVGLTEGGEVALLGLSNNYTVHKNEDLIATVPPFAFEATETLTSKHMMVNDLDMLIIQTKLEKNGWYLYEAIPVGALVESVSAIKEMTVIISVVAGIIAVIIAGFVVFNISIPLTRIRNLLVQGADGNLSMRAKVTKRKDEIGQLSKSFNLMMEKMSDLANQTKTSAEAVLSTSDILSESSKRTATSAREIAAATEEIANGATSLANEAEHGTDITLTINDQMKQVLIANEEMKISASQVEQASFQGSSYMEELTDQTAKTEALTRNMVDKVEILSDSTRSIVQILDMLTAINKQTNILSLNATIEAARAGNAGRGFMVVAHEIRTLADQSSKSIEVVANITNKIQTEIQETVTALTEVYPMFQQQTISVGKANEIFDIVQHNMTSFVEKLDQATDSVNHLEQTQNILNETMSNVSAVAQESSATSEQVASLSNEQLNVSDNLVQLSQQLSEMSQGLKDSISKFKV